MSSSKDEVFHVVNMWQVPLEKNILNKNSCDQVIQSVVKSNQGPWPKDHLTYEAPLSLIEETVAIISLLIVMGGPIYWIMILGSCTIIFGTWLQLFGYTVITLILAFHPLPDCRDSLARSFILKSWYKYFSYRFVWCGDAREVAEANAPFLGAGAPHGVMPFANLLSIPAINTTTNIDFEGCPASVVFNTPFLRYFTLLGTCDVGKPTIIRRLQSGGSVGLVSDGIAGIFHCNNHDEVVNLLNRKGISKLALELGIPILPCYSFGNTSCFSAWYDRYGILEKLSRKAQASIFFYWGKWGMPIPHRTKITMVVGKLIKVDKNPNPSQAEIDEIHQLFLNGMKDAFDTHKESLGWGEKTITFV